MLGWLRRRRETAERIEAEAEAVMREYAVRAYAEARRRECEAKSKVEAQNWSRVALIDCAQDRQARRLRHLDPDGVRRHLRLLASRTVRFVPARPQSGT